MESTVVLSYGFGETPIETVVELVARQTGVSFHQRDNYHLGIYYLAILGDVELSIEDNYGLLSSDHPGEFARVEPDHPEHRTIIKLVGNIDDETESLIEKVESLVGIELLYRL